MVRRDEDADASGEGTSWLVLPSCGRPEGIGLLGNALRERGIQHRALDIARGEPVPKDVRGVGGLIVLGGPMGRLRAGQVRLPALGVGAHREGDRRGPSGPRHLPRRAADRAGARRARLSRARSARSDGRRSRSPPDGQDDPLFAGGERVAHRLPSSRRHVRAAARRREPRDLGALRAAGVPVGRDRATASSSTWSSPSRSSPGSRRSPTRSGT